MSKLLNRNTPSNNYHQLVTIAQQGIMMTPLLLVHFNSVATETADVILCHDVRAILVATVTQQVTNHHHVITNCGDGGGGRRGHTATVHFNHELK